MLKAYKFTCPNCGADKLIRETEEVTIEELSPRVHIDVTDGNRYRRIITFPDERENGTSFYTKGMPVSKYACRMCHSGTYTIGQLIDMGALKEE